MTKNKTVQFLLWSVIILIISIVLVILWTDWPIIGLMLGSVLGIINIVIFYFINKKLNAKVKDKVLASVLKLLSIVAVHYILFFGYLLLFKPN
ncbi:hypothetical protein [Lacinutrix chionoecetis]